MLCFCGFRLGLVAVLMFVLFLAISPPAEAGQGEMYFLFCFEGCAIVRANLDGSNLSTIGETALPGLGIDLVNRKLYFSDFLFGVELPTVNRSDLDGSNEELIDTVDEITDQPTGYAVDTLHGKVYWGVSTDVFQGIMKRESQWIGRRDRRGRREPEPNCCRPVRAEDLLDGPGDRQQQDPAGRPRRLEHRDPGYGRGPACWARSASDRKWCGSNSTNTSLPQS